MTRDRLYEALYERRQSLAGGDGGSERGQETRALASARDLARTRASRAAAVQAASPRKESGTPDMASE